MHEIILSIVCIVTLSGVLGYIFFSKPKSETEKYSPLFNLSVTWGGPKEVYKNTNKAKFKGNHKKY